MTNTPSEECASHQMRTSTVACAPFDFEAAEVTFRTSDQIDFHVFKAILAMASPFFNDMFSLTQPSTTETNTTQDPIIVSEDSDTMDCLFRLCYPIDDPVIRDLKRLDRVLEAAMKYQMTEATKLMKECLLSFLDEDPLHVYAISCRLKLEEEATKAAQAWYQKAKGTFQEEGLFESTVEGASWTPEMSDVSSGAYFRLLQYCRSGGGGLPPLFCTAPRSIFQQLLDETSKPMLTIDIYPREADLILCSSDGVEFPIHTFVLQMASADRLLQLPTMNTVQGLPSVQTDMPSKALISFLALCYPLQTHVAYMDDFPTVRALLRSAKGYDMPKIVAVVKQKMLRDFAKTHAISVYFLSIEEGWTTVAQEAVKHLLNQNAMDLYSAEMEHSPAVSYYRLLEYRHACRSAAFDVIQWHAGLGQWKTLQKSLILPSESLDRTLALPLVERELQEAMNVSKCPDPSRHYYNHSGFGGQARAKTYTLNLSKLIEDSKAMEQSIQEELSTIQILLPDSPVVRTEGNSPRS